MGDANHGTEALSVSWLVDGAAVCAESSPDPEGVVICDHTFVPTGGDVVLEVRDPEGGSGSARLTVDVQPTDAPVAETTSRNTDGVYYADELTTLEGTVADEEDEALALSVVWESSLDGGLVGGFNDSEGGLLGAVTLTEGDHFLTLTVTDTNGGTPTITYAWSDGSTGSTYPLTTSDSPGDTITCTATATDADSDTDTDTDTEGGSASDSSSIIIENTDPTEPVVGIGPAGAAEGEALSCSIDTATGVLRHPRTLRAADLVPGQRWRRLRHLRHHHRSLRAAQWVCRHQRRLR